MGELLTRTNEAENLKDWLREIKACWENIPGFRVDTERLKHLAIICDGNRRAASEVIRGVARAIEKILDTATQALPDLFPDLTPQTLLTPIQDFLEYQRRLGK